MKNLILILICCLCVRTSETWAQGVRVMVNLHCREQVENGDDEIYITSATAKNNGSSQSGLVWGGDMNDDGDRRDANHLQAWIGQVLPGEMVVVTINVMEQDGDNYEPGLRFAADIAGKAAAAYLGASGSYDLAQLFGAVDLGGIVGQACAAFGCTNTDDYPGSLSVTLYNDGSGIRMFQNPLYRSRWEGDHILLDGDGSQYEARIYLAPY